jgi:hypothetical protein
MSVVSVYLMCVAVILYLLAIWKIIDIEVTENFTFSKKFLLGVIVTIAVGSALIANLY